MQCRSERRFVGAGWHVRLLTGGLAPTAWPAWLARRRGFADAGLPGGAATRSFLPAVLAAAREGCPQVRLLLFGSRAAGTARPESDYDLLLIFPDPLPPGGYGQSVGRAVSLAREAGLDLDAESIGEAEWTRPSVVHQPLVSRYGVIRSSYVRGSEV
jgi:predicted nucleotidyltransferase